MILVSTCTRLPPHPVALHHAPALGRARRGQRAAEAPERLLVLGAEQQQALSCATARQPARSADRRPRRGRARTAAGSTVVRLAVDPHRPLRRRQSSCMPSTRFHATRRARLGDADARRPAPCGACGRGSRRCRRRSPRPSNGLPEHACRASACRPACGSRCTARRAARRPRCPRPPRTPARARRSARARAPIAHRPGAAVHALVQPLAVPHRPPRDRHAADARRAPRTPSRPARRRRPSASASAGGRRARSGIRPGEAAASRSDGRGPARARRDLHARTISSRQRID